MRNIKRVRNEEIRRICRKKVSVGERMDQNVLRWLGHVERMEDDRLARKVYELEVQGPRCRGRPRKEWMDGVKEVLTKMGLTIQEAKACIQDRREWHSVPQLFLTRVTRL